MYKLISGENAARKKNPIVWNDECQIAFEKLKQLCSSTPILGFADFEKPFILHTDASLLGLGAVLYQHLDGKDRVIGYASRSLSKSESKYPVHKLEFLALKWAVTDQFHEYLYGNHFEVYTDNNPLTYVLTTAKLDATGHRWIAGLANYNFHLHYKTGKTNTDADALSRIEWNDEMRKACFDQDLSTDAVQAVVAAAIADDQCRIEAISCSTQVLEPIMTEMEIVISKIATRSSKEDDTSARPEIDLDALPEHDKTDVRPCSAGSVYMLAEDWKVAQLEDPTLRRVYELVRTNKIQQETTKRTDSNQYKNYIKQRNKLTIRKGVLYRKVAASRDDRNTMQLVVPTKFRQQAINGCHDDLGHLGIEKTLDLLRDRFYWPGLTQDTIKHIKSCERCLRFKAKPERAPMESIVATYPLELVHLDYLTIEKTEGGNDVHVLMITDHFTRYAQALITTSQTAKCTAQNLWDKFVVHYGLPEKIISDQGRNFESDLFLELCNLAQIKKVRTTAYHPQTNGQCERFNATLISMLGTLPEKPKNTWREQVPTLVHAYNCTKNNTTGFSPYYLMFGRKPRLPIDLVFGTCSAELRGNTSHKYVKDLEHRLKWAYKTANQIIAKEQDKMKRNYDRRVRCSKVQVGDLVLLKRTAFHGKHKIRDRWEKSTFKVIAQPDKSIPVFKVTALDDPMKEKTVHRNLILPIHSALKEDDVVVGSDDLVVSNTALVNVQFVHTFYQRYIQPGVGNTFSRVAALFTKSD